MEDVADKTTDNNDNNKEDKTPPAAATTTTSNQKEDERSWDNTKCKVVVHNVMKYIRNKEVDRMVNTWIKGHEESIKFLKVKKPPISPFIQLTLEKEDMVDLFINVMKDGGFKNAKGKALFVKRAGNKMDRGGGGNNNGGGKRGRGGGDRGNNSGDSRGGKRFRHEENRIPMTIDEVRDKLTPTWRKSYQEQLDQKVKDMINGCTAKIVKELKFKFRTLEKEARRNKNRDPLPLYAWLKDKKPIHVDNILPSPMQREYRNKCEFTFGYHHEFEDEKSNDGKQGNETSVKKEDEGQGKDVEKVKDENDDQMDTKEEGEGQVKETNIKEEGEGQSKETNFKKDDEGEGKDRENVKDEDDVQMDIKEDDDQGEETKFKEEGGEQGKETNSKEEDEGNVAEKTRKIKKTPAVGFMGRGWSGGISPPHCLPNIPGWACGIADILNSFLQTSPIPPYDSYVHRGLWRTATLRCSTRTRECMVIIMHAPPAGGAGAKADGSDDYTSVFEAEKERMVKMMTEGDIPVPKRNLPACSESEETSMNVEESDVKPLKVTSIFFQEFEGLSNPKPEHPVQHAFGKTSLEEQLGKCVFQISPGAFFQVNTEGAEVLYNVVVEKVKEVTENPKDTLLFDVCCGTGTIGLTCMKEEAVGRVVGVDISQPAIADARINATKNGWEVENEEEEKKSSSCQARFVASRAEHVMAKEMKGVDGPVIAVVDPAREGLHADVVKAIRSNNKISRLVYVSCNPTGSLVKDAALLCQPATKKYPGLPFKPTSARPVDMFPMTSHCEMVMTFDRTNENESSGTKEKDNKEQE